MKGEVALPENSTSAREHSEGGPFLTPRPLEASPDDATPRPGPQTNDTLPDGLQATGRREDGTAGDAREGRLRI